MSVIPLRNALILPNDYARSSLNPWLRKQFSTKINSNVDNSRNHHIENEKKTQVPEQMLSIIKHKTKVEIVINGNTDSVNWINIYKPPNTITLGDIKKVLNCQPKMYGISPGIMYSYRVKTTEDGNVGFEEIDEDLDNILPLFGDKIVLQLWSE